MIGDYLRPEEAVATPPPPPGLPAQLRGTQSFPAEVYCPGRSDRQYPRRSASRLIMLPALHVPSHSACDAGPYIKIAPLPRRGWRESVAAFPWRLSRQQPTYSSKWGNPSQCSPGPFALAQARLFFFFFETIKTTVIRTLLMLPSAGRQLIGAGTVLGRRWSCMIEHERYTVLANQPSRH